MTTDKERRRTAYTLGREAEREVAHFLEANGWVVLARNVRDGPREIDVVARRGSLVTFVEVKARSTTQAFPLHSIDWRKRRRLARAARAWIRENGRPGYVYRFDVAVVVRGEGGSSTIDLIPDAWRVGD